MMTKKIWYFFFLAIILAALTSCKKDDEEELIGNWVYIGDFEGNPRYGASSFVVNNYAYLGLGYNNKKRYTDFWVFDVTTDTWLQVADFGGEGRCYSFSFATNDKGYIIGGVSSPLQGGQMYLDDVWEYIPPKAIKDGKIVADANTNKWTVKASKYPGGVRAKGVAVGFEGKGYMGAGADADNTYKDFYEYNPSTDTWMVKPSIPGSKRRGALAFVTNNLIYVCLGENNGALYDLRAYDPAKNEWSQKADMRNATDEEFDDKYNSMQRVGGVAFNLDDMVYITTGGFTSSGTLNSSTWSYEPITDRWYQKTSFEGAQRRDAIAFTVFDSKTNKQRAFVATGVSTSGDARPYDDYWEFKPNEEQNSRDNN